MIRQALASLRWPAGWGWPERVPPGGNRWPWGQQGTSIRDGFYGCACKGVGGAVIFGNKVAVLCLINLSEGQEHCFITCECNRTPLPRRVGWLRDQLPPGKEMRMWLLPMTDLHDFNRAYEFLPCWRWAKCESAASCRFAPAAKIPQWTGGKWRKLDWTGSDQGPGNHDDQGLRLNRKLFPCFYREELFILKRLVGPRLDFVLADPSRPSSEIGQDEDESYAPKEAIDQNCRSYS